MDITPARPSDLPALCALLETLFSQEAEFQPDAPAQQRGLAMILADARIGSIVVAREADQVIGMVSLLYSVSTVLGARVAWLEDMVVAPEHRGAGIGSRLLQAAIDTAKQNGCRRITLLTDGVNAGAQRFYQRHGFGQSGMLPFRLLLDAEQ